MIFAIAKCEQLWQDIFGRIVQSYNCILTSSWIYFTWPLQKQAANKQATRKPTALSPSEGLGNEV